MEPEPLSSLNIPERQQHLRSIIAERKKGKKERKRKGVEGKKVKRESCRIEFESDQGPKSNN